MKTTRYTVPESVAKLVGRLPAYPGSWLLVQALNLALARHLPPEVQRALEGKRLRLCISDARLVFDFAWQKGGFAAAGADGDADLTISAAAHDLVLLARREEDPDTLFFSRRLSIEGDTELGLLLKNTMDAIDAPAFTLGQLAPHRLFARRWPWHGR